MLFSATFEPEVREIADAFLRPNYYFVTVGALNSAIEYVDHKFIEVSFSFYRLTQHWYCIDGSMARN